MRRFNLTTLKSLYVLVLLISANPFQQRVMASDDPRQQVLKIYNWADYIDEDLLTEFPVWYKEQTGEDIEIVYQVFDMENVMYTKVSMGQEDFDLVCPTQSIMQRMIHNDLLLPIGHDFGTTPDYMNNMSPFITARLNEYDIKGKKAGDYAVPYMWGVSGILYNTDKISADEVKSWGCFWDPKNQGKMLMKDSYSDAYATAAVYGYRDEITSGKRSVYSVINDHTETDIAMVEQQLKAMKPNLYGWEADFGKDMMTKGEIWFCYAWNGDAVWAIEEAADVNVPLAFSVPEEGSNLWFDCWVIPKYAKNTKAASYFLNYLCMPEVVLRNMDVSGYCSAVASPEILDAAIDSTLEETVNLSYFFGEGNDSLLVNPDQYPDISVVNRCAILNDFLDTNEAVLAMWSRARGDSLGSMIYLIIAVVIVAGAFIVYRSVRQAKKSKKHPKKRK